MDRCEKWPPPRLAIRATRQRQVAVTEDSLAAVCRVIIGLFERPDDARVIGLDPNEWRAWRAGEPAARGTVYWVQAEVAQTVIEPASGALAEAAADAPAVVEAEALPAHFQGRRGG